MEQQKERARAARSKIGWSDDNEYMLTDADSVLSDMILWRQRAK